MRRLRCVIHTGTALLLSLLLLAAPAAVSAETEPPASAASSEVSSQPVELPSFDDLAPGVVLDAAGMLTEEQEGTCSTTIQNFQTQYQVGMAVMTVSEEPDQLELGAALPQLALSQGGILLLVGPESDQATLYTVGEVEQTLNQIWTEELFLHHFTLQEQDDLPAFVEELTYQAGLMLQQEQPAEAAVLADQQPVYSNGDVPLDLDQKVYDFANLLTDSEEQALAAQIRDFCGRTGLDLPLVTTSDAEGKSSRDYADDFYDYNGFGVGENADGMLLLIDMDNRQAYLSTTGRAINLFTDSEIYDVTDPVAERLGDGDYYGGCQTGINRIIAHVEEENEKSTLSGRFARSARRLPFYLLAAGGLTALILYGMTRSHKTARRAQHAGSYLDQQSLAFPLREDTFIRSSLTRRKIESSSGGGGGTSTHRSSSGRSHGGGGSSF